MEKLYRYLEGPISPLIDGFEFPSAKLGYYVYDDSIINSHVRDYYLKLLGLNISIAILFCRPPRAPGPNPHIPWPKDARENQGFIHSDISWVDGHWERFYYAVNYEVSSSVSKLTWWETTDEEVYPPDPDPPTFYDKLHGIHFGQRSNLDPLHSGYKKIDSLEVGNFPVLINTIVPHSADYGGLNSLRWGLSLRFNRQVSSWEEAVELFRPIIKE